MTEMPPTRFRVIERGRRLVVIDTRAPKAVAEVGPRSGRGGRGSMAGAR
ncbi:hypothetical protein [uncultured Sphingomonas sp.]|nr:hypothetical protein [uncultured Sphingomonas sp.]